MPSYLPLIVANIIPVFFIIFDNWAVGPVILLYWAENIVIGFYNICRIIIAPVGHPVLWVGKVFKILFFLIHFGGFCAIHGMLVFGMVSEYEAGTVDVSMDGDMGFKFGPFVFVALLINVVRHFFETASVETLFSVLALFVSHGLSFIFNYWRSGEYQKKNTQDLMTDPYQRVIVLHLVIIAGGFAVLALKSPVPLVILLVLVKIIIDVKLHQKSHQRASELG